MPTTVAYVPPPRFVAWLERSDRRIVCACGHRFTPDLTVDRGSGTLRCRGDAGRPCGRLLLLMMIPKAAFKLVAEVSRADLLHMETEHMLPETQIAYLFTAAPRAD